MSYRSSHRSGIELRQCLARLFELHEQPLCSCYQGAHSRAPCRRSLSATLRAVEPPAFALTTNAERSIAYHAMPAKLARGALSLDEGALARDVATAHRAVDAGSTAFGARHWLPVYRASCLRHRCLAFLLFVLRCALCFALTLRGLPRRCAPSLSVTCHKADTSHRYTPSLLRTLRVRWRSVATLE